MEIYVTRDSVCAGDDVYAPHERTLRVPDGAALEACIHAVLKSKYLPSIAGGEASWSVASGIPLAVVAQQWAAPKLLFLTSQDLASLDGKPDRLRLHFSYHAQRDPEVVLDVLRRLQLRAT